MFRNSKIGKNRRKIALLASVAALTAIVSGCQGFNFYRQAIAGQFEILAHQKPIQKLIVDPTTPPKLKEKFEQVLTIRNFAAKELKLPVEGSYLKYVDLHRPFAVWNVYAAPKLSIDAKTWWFPVVGCVSYRGYFQKTTAQSYGGKLADKGFDVYVSGIETYSTLGWFRDPLLNTFINEPEADLAEIIFHELAHQRLYVAGDTDFDEAFATAVAEEGLERWFQALQKPEALARFRTASEETARFVKLIKVTRDQLEAAYNDARLTDTNKLERKERIIAELRKNHEKMKVQFGGKSVYDAWFSGTINNAKLNTVSTYYDLVPAFRELLRINGGDMERFYEAVAKLGKMKKPRRLLEMEKLVNKAPAPLPAS